MISLKKSSCLYLMLALSCYFFVVAKVHKHREGLILPVWYLVTFFPDVEGFLLTADPLEEK